MAKDDNGYITRVEAETGEIAPKCIDGKREEVTLYGPRGRAIPMRLMRCTALVLKGRSNRLRRAKTCTVPTAYGSML